MKKFNEFENLITEGVKKVIKELENEIKNAEDNNKRHIMASGYPTMIEKELLEKLDNLTKFYKKKK